MPSIHKCRHHLWAHLWGYDHRAHSGSEIGWESHFVGFPRKQRHKKICNTLQSIEMCLSHGVNIGCNIAIPKQMSMGNNHDKWIGKKSYWRGTQTQICRGQFKSHNVIFPSPVWPPSWWVKCQNLAYLVQTIQKVGLIWVMDIWS